LQKEPKGSFFIISEVRLAPLAFRIYMRGMRHVPIP